LPIKNICPEHFNENGKKGQGRIIINILNENNEIVESVLSEGDGYFTYLGLSPGNYTAEIDKQQLENLNFTSSEAQSFEIEMNEYGNIVDNLEFIIEENQ